MQLNSLIFPAPVASYSLNSELIWIPKSPSSPLFSPTRTSKNSFRISMKRKDLGQEIEQSSFASCKDFKTPTNFSSFHTSLQHRNSFTLRKIKDFGFHNHLFSMKTTHSTSHKNENPKVKGMNFKSFSQQNTENSIPCLFYEYPEKSNFLLVHFHANAEDIGDSFKYMKIVGSLLKMNCLLVEYPGYGLYKGKCNSETILKDSETVINYLIKDLAIPEKHIIPIGRSVGTGPATHVASKYDMGGLILVSPYTSLKKLVGDHFGKLAKWMIAERFQNIEKIANVNCPTILIHGDMDELISSNHSFELQKKIKDGVYSEVYISKTMTHNKLHLINDMVKPIVKFLIKTNIWYNNSQNPELSINAPKNLRVSSSERIYRKGKSFINTFFMNKSKNCPKKI